MSWRLPHGRFKESAFDSSARLQDYVLAHGQQEKDRSPAGSVHGDARGRRAGHISTGGRRLKSMIEITKQDFSLDEMVKRAKRMDAGAVVTFLRHRQGRRH